MAQAYEILPGGGVRIHDIPAGGLAIDCGELLLDGAENEDFQTWTLASMVEIKERVVPFATCWCAPTFKSSTRDEGRKYVGMAYAAHDTIFVSSDIPKRGSRSVCYHECAHIVESNVNAGFLKVWTSAADIQEWDEEYLNRDGEKRCNLLAACADLLDRGGQLTITPGSISEVLYAIYSGQTGKAIVASRAAQAAADARAARPSLWNRIKLAA